ncbi:MAG: SGNH/GDSL hydrolase family protein [Clostridiales bacterium]|nr:SGNH/GDSL hydrolase family protein [Clostridiales bacterium]
MHPYRNLILFAVIFAFILSPCGATLKAEGDIIDHIVFFGDSTTAHLAVRGGIPKERVWSGAGNTVLFETVNRTKCVHLEEENLDLSLSDAVALKKPEILVITLGVSGGAGFLPRDKFVAIYREMLESVKDASPDTRIVVQSILPLSDKSVNHYKDAVTGTGLLG